MSDPVASALVALNGSPPSVESVWALPFLMAAEWGGGCSVTHTHRNAIDAARTTSERRVGRTAKPSRIVKFSLAPYAAGAVWSILEAARRQAVARSLVPLYPDGADTTAATSADTVPVDTTYRRFYPGARVAVAAPYSGGSAVFPAYETGIIADVDPAALTLTADLSRVYPKGSRVYPLVECDVVPDWAATLTTRSSAGASFACREVAGPSALPPLLDYGAESPVATLDGLPVWSPPVGWAEGGASVGFFMDMLTTSLGAGVVNVPLASRPRWKVSGTSILSGRAAVFEQLRFFDWCAGRLRAFLCVLPTDSFTVQAVSGSMLVVDAVGPGPSQWQGMTHVAAVGWDGSTYPARVLSATRTGGVDRVLLDRPLGVAKQNVARVAPAFVGRFNADEVTEQWTTAGLASVAWSVVEVLNEKSVEIS